MLQKIARKLRTILFVFRSIYSLTQNTPGTSAVIFRPIYEKNVSSSTPSLFMNENEVIPSLWSVVHERGIQPTLPYRPYWNQDREYSLLEVLGSTIQFTDSHKAPLPETVFPPQKDVEAFLGLINAISHPAKLCEQFTAALDITGNNILGAINLCWISTRLMARGADQRAYPGILINATELQRWNERVARFETHEIAGKNDGPGDNYYFWTHVFAAMIFSSGSIGASAIQLVYDKGTQIMTFVRNYIARKQPNMTSHQPASSLGRKFGLSLATLNSQK